MRIQKPEDVNLSNLIFSEPKLNASGGRTIYIKNGVRRIYMMTPKSQMPFGIQEYISDCKRYSIHTLLQQTDFKLFLQKLDSFIINRATDNSELWFGKQIDLQTVKGLYNPCLKDSLFRTRLPTKNGHFEGSVYDEHGNLISIDNLEESCYVELLLECSGLYFIAKEFGVSWKVVQIRAYPNDVLDDNAFLSDDSFDSDAEPN